MKPKTRRKKSNNYFTKDTEEAIILYNKTEDPNIRSRMYEREIHYPFFKLTQNIIHTFKFYHTEVENLEHLQHEIIVFLLTKMHLYHHSRSINRRLNKIINKDFQQVKTTYDPVTGEPTLEPLYTDGHFLEYTNNSPRVELQHLKDYIIELDVSEECMAKLIKLGIPKAYSYFGTIVKRWLIIYTENSYNKKIQHVDVGELFNGNNNHTYDSENTKNQDLKNYFEKFIEYCDENLYELFPKKNDVKIADAILELFRKIESREEFNKKELYMSIREILSLSGIVVQTPKITKIAKKLEIIFSKGYDYYLTNYHIKFDSPDIYNKIKL